MQKLYKTKTNTQMVTGDSPEGSSATYLLLHKFEDFKLCLITIIMLNQNDTLRLRRQIQPACIYCKRMYVSKCIQKKIKMKHI